MFISTLLAGVTATAASGTDSDAVLADLGTLAAAISTGADSRLHFIAHADVTKRLSLMADGAGRLALPGMGISGGRIGPFSVHGTIDIDDDDALAFDARSIAADGGEIVLDASQSATPHFDDDPNVETGDRISLFQTDNVGLRVRRWFGFEPVRSSAVAALSGVTWGSSESPA